MIFQISYQDFVDQIMKWNVTRNSLYRVIMEESGNIVAFFLPLDNLMYATVVRKDEMAPADMMNFDAIAMKGRRFNEVERLRINKAFRKEEVRLENVPNY